MDKIGWEKLSGPREYYVIYKNQGKLEKTPGLVSKKQAEAMVDFLQFQGATGIKIKRRY